MTKDIKHQRPDEHEPQSLASTMYRKYRRQMNADNNEQALDATTRYSLFGSNNLAHRKAEFIDQIIDKVAANEKRLNQIDAIVSQISEASTEKSNTISGATRHARGNTITNIFKRCKDWIDESLARLTRPTLIVAMSTFTAIFIGIHVFTGTSNNSASSVNSIELPDALFTASVSDALTKGVALSDFGMSLTSGKSETNIFYRLGISTTQIAVAHDLGEMELVSELVKSVKDNKDVHEKHKIYEEINAFTTSALGNTSKEELGSKINAIFEKLSAKSDLEHPINDLYAFGQIIEALRLSLVLAKENDSFDAFFSVRESYMNMAFDQTLSPYIPELSITLTELNELLGISENLNSRRFRDVNRVIDRINVILQ